ncbi:MAG TPA: hypothetical protein PLD62_11545 [Candidatus Cloacimonadota bacterium]|nr:hypothetical protein [Candidatus Cloacimonadota bacterium]
MKEKITIIFCLIVFSLFGKGLYFDYDFSLETTYDSNVLKLSDHDLDRFEAGNDGEKFDLETTDDLIFSPLLRLEGKNYWISGHTQKHEIFLKYNKYLKNDCLDDGYLGYKFTQFLSRKVNLELSYFYYPEIYVNRYQSVLDQVPTYHDYTYEKNGYNAAIEWKTTELFELTYHMGLAQLLYNKYFTEYDALNFDNSIKVLLYPKGKIRTSLSYEYVNSAADGEDAYDDDEVDEIKDASYESNTYSVSYYIPTLIKIGKKKISLSAGADYEQRYYQTNREDDTYHYSREDYTVTADAALGIDLNKSFGLRLSGKYQKRNTDSPSSTVERDKNYDMYETGLKISCKF